MSSAKRSAPRSASKFTLDDVNCVITSHKKSLSPSTVPPKPVNTRSKTVAHKCKKILEPEDEFESAEKSIHDLVSEHIASLKRSYSNNLKEREDSLEAVSASLASHEKARAKKIKALETQLEAAHRKAEEDLEAATQEAKIWVARSVIQARLKMEKEAMDPDFDKANWDVAKWEQKLVELGEDEAGEDQAGGSGTSKDEEAVAGEDGGAVRVGDDGVMKA